MDKIRERLFLLADEKYKKFHSSLCPGTNNIIGIRVPFFEILQKRLQKVIGSNI